MCIRDRLYSFSYAFLSMPAAEYAKSCCNANALQQQFFFSDPITFSVYPYVGIIQIRLRVLSDPAFSQPAFCKHPFFVSVDIINTLILGIKCYLNFLFALEEALREVPVSLQPESSRHPEYNQMHRPDTYLSLIHI